MERFDIAVIGAGAAGLMCAATAGHLGQRVVLLDHARTIAEKIRISGGGRCNFTNLGATPRQFLSENPAFCRSALARYTPADFLDLLRRHGVAWHEKHKGQLFCDESSQAIITMLRDECASARVSLRHPVKVAAIEAHGEREGFRLSTDGGLIDCAALIIAAGGLSIPAIGASDFAYRVARQFGLRVVSPEPALVPLTFGAQDWAPFAALSGLSLEVEIRTGGSAASGSKASRERPERAKGADAPYGEFLEDLLFTHRGLSGPAVLQISSYWRLKNEIAINLLPGRDAGEALLNAKRDSRRQLGTVLAEWLPARLVEVWLHTHGMAHTARVAELPDRALRALGDALNLWRITPQGSAGWRKAEVTRGGVDTRDLSSTTLAAKGRADLYFIGEAVDVTGWLGGYNFQWAWASGVAAARAAAQARRRP